MTERMTEEKVAALEAAWRSKERQMEIALELDRRDDPQIGRRIRRGPSGVEVSEAERAYLEGRAQLERQRREEADTATAEVVSANRDMAAASREAARYSAESARASQRSARWTLVAAAVATIGVLVQAWQGCRSVPQRPQPPAAGAATTP